ncbi:YkgJ family cysteine cluster protein [Desulfospira joergensenii]|uniref:YkgJ family cysteine cluster protein n=1 Tax=Desulfospira joergensenii TaxID=53329 RepID=UPI0003B31583|nr:YkgJ family cysteine cluster protein [Desulfospira joergensenii]
MKESEGPADQDLFKTILEKIFLEKVYHGFLKDSVLSVAVEVMEYVQNIIQDLEESGQAPQVSCRNGCDFCCYSHITILPIEALLIYSFVQDQFTDSELTVLREKIKTKHRLIRGKTLEEKFDLKEKTPCIFLRDGACRIYPVRPFICRAWNSLDASECRAAFHADNLHARIESSSARNHVFESARDLFLDISRQLHLETDRLELSRAVSRCLEVSGPMTLWLAGHGILNPEPIPVPDKASMGDGGENQGRKTEKPGSITENPMAREMDYVDYFYQKYRGRVSLGVGYHQNLSEIYPFIFQNVHGKPIGIVAMGAVSNGEKAVHIYHIGSFVTRQGKGSQILQELCRKADCFNIHLSVSPVFMPNGKDPHMNYGLLTEWYEKFDFKGEANLLRSPRKKTN